MTDHYCVLVRVDFSFNPVFLDFLWIILIAIIMRLVLHIGFPFNLYELQYGCFVLFTSTAWGKETHTFCDATLRNNSSKKFLSTKKHMIMAQWFTIIFYRESFPVLHVLPHLCLPVWRSALTHLWDLVSCKHLWFSTMVVVIFLLQLKSGPTKMLMIKYAIGDSEACWL